MKAWLAERLVRTLRITWQTAAARILRAIREEDAANAFVFTENVMSCQDVYFLQKLRGLMIDP